MQIRGEGRESFRLERMRFLVLLQLLATKERSN